MNPIQKTKKQPGTASVIPKESWWQANRIAVLLLALVLVFYGNTIFNKYALDDGLVIYENPYTMEGFAGIGDILSHDSYYGYYQQFGSEGALSGGRYRPLSIITFAIEYEIFGENPAIGHFINILIYALTILLLLVLLKKYWFKAHPEIAVLSVLLFAIHPIHTEAVANIKGRDELLSLLFLVLGLIYSFRFARKPKTGLILIAAGCYSLALLSKENGITFLAIIPLALVLFARQNMKQAILQSLPFLGVALLYLLIRQQVVSTGGADAIDVMNDPFFFASSAQKYATITVILLSYLKLLILPHPLSYDYGFYQVPYYNFGDAWVIFSVLLHLSLIGFALVKMKKYPIISFSILFYFITISIVSNLVIDLGATMGERLIYHSSLGFAIAMAAMLIGLRKKIWPAKSTIYKQAGWLFVGLLIIACGYKTITRNGDWKNNTTLFLADVNAAPNSVKANNAAATASTEMADKSENEADKNRYLQNGLNYLAKAKSIYPNLADIFMNEGVIYYRLQQWENAETAWNRARELFPSHPKFREYDPFLVQSFYSEGIQSGAAGDVDKAIYYLEKAARYGPNVFETWYNLGGAYYTKGNYQKAMEAFQKSLAINPGHTESQQGLQSCKQLLGLEAIP